MTAPARFAPPVLLAKEHESADFKSGEMALDDWLRKRALKNLSLGASRTYVVCSGDSRQISGFHAITLGHIHAGDVTGAMRRNMPDFIPAVVLGRLAIDLRWQGQGLGAALLYDAVARSRAAAREVAVRLVVVLALSPSAEAFYLHHGFTRLPTEERKLALDLVKLDKIGG